MGLLELASPAHYGIEVKKTDLLLCRRLGWFEIYFEGLQARPRRNAIRPRVLSSWWLLIPAPDLQLVGIDMRRGESKISANECRLGPLPILPELVLLERLQGRMINFPSPRFCRLLSGKCRPPNWAATRLLRTCPLSIHLHSRKSKVS